jgi:hypothetical protein
MLTSGAHHGAMIAEKFATSIGNDAILLDQIPRTLTFVGEFGAEVNSFLPFVYWLFLQGGMQGRVVETYLGMAPFYRFLDAGQVTERAVQRVYVPPEHRPYYLPNKNDHAARRSACEVFPNYRALVPPLDLGTGKPILVLHNKFGCEWGGPPVNFLPVETLRGIIDTLRAHFTATIRTITSQISILPSKPSFAAFPICWCLRTF